MKDYRFPPAVSVQIGGRIGEGEVEMVLYKIQGAGKDIRLWIKQYSKEVRNFTKVI